MAHFEDIGYEESVRITLIFDQDEYDMIEYVCKRKGVSKKEYFNSMIKECILYMNDECACTVIKDYILSSKKGPAF